MLLCEGLRFYCVVLSMILSMPLPSPPTFLATDFDKDAGWEAEAKPGTELNRLPALEKMLTANPKSKIK